MAGKPHKIQRNEKKDANKRQVSKFTKLKPEKRAKKPKKTNQKKKENLIIRIFGINRQLPI